MEFCDHVYTTSNKIRSLYNKLHDDTYANNTVFSIDLNITRSLFNEYVYCEI